MKSTFPAYSVSSSAYDQRLGQFLSPDIMVQDPTNTQSYNRYAYCLNNPMKYTDPSGYTAGYYVDGMPMYESYHSFMWRKGWQGMDVASVVANGREMYNSKNGHWERYDGGVASFGNQGKNSVLKFISDQNLSEQMHVIGKNWVPGESIKDPKKGKNSFLKNSNIINNWAVNPVSNVTSTIAGLRYTSSFGFLRTGYFMTSRGAYYSLSVLKPLENGKFIQGITGLRYGMNTAANSVKVIGSVGRIAGGIGVVLSGYNFYNDPSLFNGFELGVSLISIPFWEVGAIYFAGKLFYQITEFNVNYQMSEGINPGMNFIINKE